MSTETIGQRVRRLRLSAGYRFQKDFAKAIQIDPASLNQIEQGYRVPKLQTLDKMATALGVSRDLILDGKESAARAMPPRPSELAPVAAPEQPPMTDARRNADTNQLDPDLHALIRTSVQAEIRNELRNFAVDIATSIAASITRRPATAPRQGARPRAHRV